MQLLQVGGLTPLTTTDYPGCLAAVVFCQGCPWSCGYCHNPHLQPVGQTSQLEWDRVLAFLKRRIGLLDAVVFSGGEPLLQAGLEQAIRDVRDLGFKAGLHTGGAYPSRLERLLPLLDWVGMDLKAPFDDYPRITGVPGSGAKALAGARLLLESGVAHEFRTTFHPSLLERAEVLQLAEALAGLGAKRYVLQEFRGQGCADPALAAFSPSDPDREWYGQVALRIAEFAVRPV